VRLGVIPAVISATVLPRLLPRAAAQFYLTGEVFDGSRAAAAGLVTAAVPADDLDAAVAGYCDALVRGGPLALAATVRADLAELSERSAAYFRSDEGREGVAAFREKRPASWIPQ
jgi:methylglutaconyl-CoA hydratase